MNTENPLQRTLLIHPEFHGDAGDGIAARNEFEQLAISAELTVVARLHAPRDRPDPRWLIGQGKVDEARALVEAHHVELVLVNHTLSPIQQRNLSRDLGCRVLDRTTLILDIFARRARSHEGQLQVELAQLRHLATRLVRGWTHLERQRGGIGLRGPGETQLETDRRLIGDRIRMLKGRLEKVQRRREQGRRARARAGHPLVALVGYTNAGKSTLFNRITQAEVTARDQLFATLDPTVRRLAGASGSPVLVSDTVGFLRDLPHELIAAFRATLEETLAASLIVQVIDAADPAHDLHDAVVDEVLNEIGAGALPRLKVYNKADRTDSAPMLRHDADGRPEAVWLSAATGAGVEWLYQAIDEHVHATRIHRWIHLPVERQRLRARLFDLGAVAREERDTDGGSRLEVNLDARQARQLARLDDGDGRLAEKLLLQ